jgi:hypothetical protein
VQWNHSDLSGVPPRVGCWLGGYWEIGGGCSYLGLRASGYALDCGGCGADQVKL